MAEQIIMHVDMDAFYASVEVRDDPSLRGKPLIIGALPNERGVVSTCSYEARKFGVHSGMSIKDAYRLCPNGIYRHPNFEKYREASHKLHDIWNTYATALEGISLDEAYLDITEQAVDFEGARKIAEIIKERTMKEVRLTCSIGVAYSKIAAKTASEENKPNGFCEIRSTEDFIELMNDRDVRKLHTVGEKTAEKMYSAGIHTVRDVRENPETVVRLLGKTGRWIVQIANGIDSRKVEPYLPENAKSISRELTFQFDIDNDTLVRDVMFLLALSVDRKAKRYGLYGKGVSIKITFSDMQSVTRSRLVEVIDSPMTIYNEAVRLFSTVTQRPIRLVGVGIYNLTRGFARQLSFEDIDREMTSDMDSQMKEKLESMQRRYGLDFAGNLEKIFHGETLYRTAEYMRKHI